MSFDAAASGGDLLAYRAPVADILDALDVTGLDDVLALPAFAHVDRSAVAAVVAEFGRFAGEVVAPTDRVGDQEGSRFDPADGTVRTPAAFAPAYRQYVATGWGAVSAPEEHGGGGFPAVVGMALQEMLASANLSLSLNPVLTQSAIELLTAWGTPDQQARFLPRLVVGEWTGTMNLTEPDAGSDLGAVQTRAEQGPDGRWRVTGTKIFITWGDHDLAANVVHLVLARTPGAPAGTKGLSLFLVPKFLVDPAGVPGARNAVHCVGLEHKLGLHGSPTCVMSYDAADGELVGELHGGITAMFTMMNTARLAIGMQGPAVAERAFQHAHRYAAARLQGRALGVAPPARSPIVDHPDVRRMLLSMRTTTLAGRMLVYLATHHRDLARHAPDAGHRAAAQAAVDLLTPVAKAWPTDAGIAAASAGLQVLGGAGYIEESGMAQRLRDSRITAVYEGTNGIQAIDLVTRKIPSDGGRAVRDLIDTIARTAAAPDPPPAAAAGMLDASHDCLAEAVAVLADLTDQLRQRPTGDVLAGASAYLELFGLTLGGWLMLRRAQRAIAAADGAEGAAGNTEGAPGSTEGAPGSADIAALESEFFATEHTARAAGLVRPILAGARRLDALQP